MESEEKRLKGFAKFVIYFAIIGNFLQLIFNSNTIDVFIGNLIVLTLFSLVLFKVTKKIAIILIKFLFIFSMAFSFFAMTNFILDEYSIAYNIGGFIASCAWLLYFEFSKDIKGYINS